MNAPVIVVSNIQRHYIDKDTGKAVVKKLTKEEATEWIKNQLTKEEESDDTTNN